MSGEREGGKPSVVLEQPKAEGVSPRREDSLVIGGEKYSSLGLAAWRLVTRSSLCWVMEEKS